MKKVAVVGIANTFASSLAYVLESRGYKVEFYIDSYNKHPRFKTIKPSEVSNYVKDPEDFVFMFTFPIVGHRVVVMETLKNLLGENIEWWDYKKVFNEFREVFSIIDEYYWFKRKGMFSEENIVDLFEEDKSRRIVNNWIEFRRTYNVHALEEPEGEQYLPSDLDIIDSFPEVYNFMDVGAYDGDTLEYFLKKSAQFGKKIGMYVGFKPDKRNFSKLLKRIEDLHQEYSKTVYIPIMAGCGDNFDVLEFHQMYYGSCSGFIQLNPAIQEVDIQKAYIIIPDDTFINLKFHAVKMDTEGYELPCLRGIEKIIRMYRPVLMVSIYHKPEDLYEIPKFIKGLEPTYRLYVRVHATFFAETVLYALPNHGEV